MTIKAEFTGDHDRLTEREADVALLLAEGYSDKAIAAFLAISIKTVSIHTQHIYEKLGLRSHELNARCAAIGTMIAKGMVKLTFNCIFAALIFGALQLDDSAARVGSARVRATTARVRVRRDNA